MIFCLLLRTVMSQYKTFEDILDGCLEEDKPEEEEEKSKWVIRMELNAEEMLDRGLNMDDINFAIKNAYRDQVSCVFSDYNDDNLVFRLRLNNVLKKKSAKKIDPLDQQDEIYMLKNFQDQLLDNLVLRGIKNIDKLIPRKITDTMIYQDGSYSKQEIWILAKRFNLPLIFYSGTKLLENNLPILVANKDDSSPNEFYFIKVPGSRPNIVPKFRLLVSGNPPTALLDTSLLSVGFRADINKQFADTSVETFLRNFEKPKQKPRKKLKLVKKIGKTEAEAATTEKKKRGRPRKLKKKLKLKPVAKDE